MDKYNIKVIVEITLHAFSEDDAKEAVEEAIREIEGLGGVVENSLVISIEKSS